MVVGNREGSAVVTEDGVQDLADRKGRSVRRPFGNADNVAKPIR
jgi:hypothetical protein